MRLEPNQADSASVGCLKPGAGTRPPGFGEALRFWLKLGFISFGGPTGQIAIMHRELVEKRRWISDNRFLHALNYCMLLPGPEAQHTYIGWLLHRTWGGIVAGSLFFLPSVLILWTLSFVYVLYGDLPWIAAIFSGLKPAVLAIVATAVIRIGTKILKNGVMWCIAATAFVAIFFLNVPFPAIILTAGVTGFLGGRLWRAKFLVLGGHASTSSNPSVLDDDSEPPTHARPSLARALRISVVGLSLWWGPVLTVGVWLGWNHTLFQEGVFFSKAALVTFGGAYAVLPYVAQQAVETHAWLDAGQMLDGLGLAESTPGPLIMVLQFVGFLGGWHHPEPLSPLVAATIGALLTTWTTFVPCFLWIFLGAPHIEQLRGRPVLTAALSAVTAAVVGVILNLAVWFGWHVFVPEPNLIDWFAIALGSFALIGLLRWKWDIIPVILVAGLLGFLGRGWLGL
jgi:chromate transporter